MIIESFALERYFAKHEFSAKFLLSSSDCESLSLKTLLSMADEESFTLWNDLKLGYTESQGHPLLREEISCLYTEINHEEVVLCVPEEGIFLLMHALLKPGDHIITTFPGYQSLYQVATSLGCRVSKWEPDESAGWKFDLESLKSDLQPNTKLIVVNFPHNPTGYVPSSEEYFALIDLARQREIYLFSDEMYRFLETDEETRLPSASDLYNRAISLFGMSKTFGLPGLRIGWLTSQDMDTLERVIQLKDYTTICSSAPSEILSLIALRNHTEIINQQKATLGDNLGYLDQFMDTYKEHFRWNPPLGGSICFPRMLGVENTFHFCERLVKETGIMIAPSRLFQYGDHHIRIGFGRQNFKEVLGHFGKEMNNYEVNK